MRDLIMRYVALLMLGCFLAGCADYQSIDNEHQMIKSCEEQAETICQVAFCKYERWVDEVCRGWETCCFCRCWNDGRQVPDDMEECTCVEAETPDEPGDCYGDMLQFSEECLENEDWCRENLEMALTDLCTYW
jgi:hypothetical protein